MSKRYSKYERVSQEDAEDAEDLVHTANLLGIFAVLACLLGLGLFLGPLAVRKAVKAMHLDPYVKDPFSSIAMGVIGFALSLTFAIKAFF